MNEKEFIKRLEQNRENTDWMLNELQPEEPPEPPPPPPEPHHICKYPLPEVGKVNGWSGFGYESLPFREDEEIFTDELWTQCADLLAKNAVNYITFFAYCSEDDYYLDNTYSPFPSIASQVSPNVHRWDCEEIDQTYIDKISPRLEDFHSRKVTTELVLGSGIKGVANRWDYSYFNGKNNKNGTTIDVARFYDDEKTREVYKTYIQNYALLFNGPYTKFKLMNEPSAKVGRIIDWNWYMIDALKEVGIPEDRVVIQYFNDHRIFEFLKAGVWVVVHGINSEKTVMKWYQSPERKPLLLYPNFILCGDGGDEFGEGKGLIGLGHNPDFRKAAARQERSMVRINLQNGGAGIDFMPALAFLDGKVPNLQRIIDHGENGFTETELEDLASKLSIPIDHSLNKQGELKEIRAAFVNNLQE